MDGHQRREFISKVSAAHAKAMEIFAADTAVSTQCMQWGMMLGLERCSALAGFTVVSERLADARTQMIGNLAPVKEG